jgi:TonB family protein
MLTTQEPTKAVRPVENAGLDGRALVEGCPTRLTGELARESLPQDTPDPNAKFAWANAICALFAIIGVVGIFQPLFVLAAPAMTKKPFIVPVLFNPPPPQPTVSQAVASDSAPQENSPEPVELPDLVPAVTPMNAQVAFAVPVEGPVRLVAAKYAVPPPAKLKPVQAPPANNGKPGGGSGNVVGDAVAFEATLGDGGVYPKPPYPTWANRAGVQGDVMLEVYVTSAGVAHSITVSQTTGSRSLDNYTLEWVKKRWRFPVGPERRYLVPFSYKLSSRP